MKKTVNILRVNIADLSDLSDVIYDEFKNSSDIKLVDINTISDLPSIIDKMDNAILIMKLNSKTELTQTLKLLRKYSDLNANGFFKTICILESNNSKVSKILAKYGCFDVLQTSTNLKTIVYKLNNWTQTFQVNWDKNLNVKLSEVKLKNEVATEDLNLNFREDMGNPNEILEELLESSDGKLFGIDITKICKRKEDLSSLLVPSDVKLESGKITVTLSQTNNEEVIYYICQFKDLYDHCIWLTLAKGTEFFKSPLHLKLDIEYDGQSVLIDDEVEVVQREDYDDNFESCQLQLSEKSINAVSEFLKVVRKRQESVDDFLLKAKGH